MIQEVYAHNLEEELVKIGVLTDSYNYISIDSEFPGIVARPKGNFRSMNEQNYQQLRINVNFLKVIQLGITLSDKDGNHPRPICSWQFNFRFNIDEDMYLEESIVLLKEAGIDFEKLKVDGIDYFKFGELLTVSGIILTNNINWICFHGLYDFAYIIKLVTGNPLPECEEGFFCLLKIFGAIYDIKYIHMQFKSNKGGLQDVADELHIERIGCKHQAGSDSLLTSMTFVKIREMLNAMNVNLAIVRGNLYGLSGGYKNYYKKK